MEPDDIPRLEQIHAAMHLDYRLPDLTSPLWITRKVASLANERVGACCLRLTAEAYLLLDPMLDPRGKMAAMRALQPAVLRDAWSKGIDDVECRIPLAVERRFEKRLRQLGWTRDRSEWWPWSRATAEKGNE